MHLRDIISGMTSLLSAVVWIRAKRHGWGHCITNSIGCVNATGRGIQLLCRSDGNVQSQEENSNYLCPRPRYLPCRCRCNGTSVHDDSIDSCRLMSTMTSEISGVNYMLLRAAITRFQLGNVHPNLWPDRKRREVGDSNLSYYFKEYSHEYPNRNASNYSNDNLTLNLTDHSNDHETHNSTRNPKDHYRDYSIVNYTNAPLRATELLSTLMLRNRFEVSNYHAKSFDVTNDVKTTDQHGRQVALNDVTTQSEASTLNDAITQMRILTHRSELFGSLKTAKGAKDPTNQFLTLIQNDTFNDGTSQSQGMTTNAFTDRDMTPADHVMATSDNQVTSITYMASPLDARLKPDVMSNDVTVGDTSNVKGSDDAVTVTSQFIGDSGKESSILAWTRMNLLISNNVTITDSMMTESKVTDSMATDSMVTDSMVTDSMVTESVVIDSKLTKATAIGNYSESVEENDTIDPEASALDATTSDTTTFVSMPTIVMATSNGNGGREDELVIYYDDCPVSGATMAFLAMVLVLVAMVIVLNCYGPRWGHVYRWRYGCRQRPAGPRITADDNLCPMAHLAKVSDLPVLVEQRAY